MTQAAAAAGISRRHVQVGLVAILFVGAATSVALALAGVTSYVVLAVTRRTREMGVLRALGFPRRGVATTFAVEQVVELGLGALVGTLGGVALTWAMLIVVLSRRTDRVVRLQDGRMATQDRVARRTVGPDGTIRFPRDRLVEAGIGDTAEAWYQSNGIMIRRDPMQSGEG